MENRPLGTFRIFIDRSLYGGETSCVNAYSNKSMYIHKQKYGQISYIPGIS